MSAFLFGFFGGISRGLFGARLGFGLGRALLILLAFVGFALPEASAQSAGRDEFVVPALTGPVVDAAGLLSPQTRTVLARGIRKLHESGGTQITVVTVPTLGQNAIEQASIKITDAWKLGGEKTDNGILLLVAPTERKVRIEVGQGLEGTLPDAFANRIVQDSILPEFKRQDFDNGVFVGVVEIIKKTDPGVNLQQLFGGETERPQSSGRRGIPLWLLIAIPFILISLFRGGGGGGRRRGISPWGAAALGYGLGGLGRGGGGGGFGGGGGGGWGGGGGGFSGGGASGGW